MKTIFIIQHCDNVPYEESYTAIMATRSRRQAEWIVNRITDWINTETQNLPKSNSFEPDEIVKLCMKRNRLVKKLKPPFGLEILKHGLGYFRPGTVTFYEIPLM